MEQWVMWVLIFGFLAIFMIMNVLRAKKQQKQSAEIMNSFQVGDKVITHIGIYGRIKKIYNTTYGKVCVLEIGDKNKVDVEMDMRYIAGKDEKTLEPDEKPKEQKNEIVKESKDTKVEEKDEEIFETK